MANRSKQAKIRNHNRQLEYLAKGITMLPTLAEERQAAKKAKKAKGNA